jgi:hypothetical protein
LAQKLWQKPQIFPFQPQSQIWCTTLYMQLFQHKNITMLGIRMMSQRSTDLFSMYFVGQTKCNCPQMKRGSLRTWEICLNNIVLGWNTYLLQKSKTKYFICKVVKSASVDYNTNKWYLKPFLYQNCKNCKVLLPINIWIGLKYSWIFLMCKEMQKLHC